MKAKSLSTVSSLAVIMSFRMLGLFMILPVFAVYAQKIPDATPALIGLALGIYGLTQACLQMPFGALSDRFGRKPIILLGLILFALGSLLAALSHSIYGLIIGRALQGTGAIGSTILATVADLTRDEDRNKAMAMIGLAIGLSFSIAMVLGPLLSSWFNLAGIFWATLLLALIGIVLLYTTVPTPPRLITHPEVEPMGNQFRNVLKNKQLLRLNFGILASHCIFTATFIAIPVLLFHNLHLSEKYQILFYLIIISLAFITMLPFIIIGEKKRKIKAVFITSVTTLVVAELLLLFSNHHLIIISLLLFLFFTAFTLLEATLPSLVSKISPLQSKGTAMGVYSSSQFLGIFIGGSVGGWIFGHFHLSGVFIFCFIVGIAWLLVAISMAQPPYLSTIIISANERISQSFSSLKTVLQGINGVADIAFSQAEQLIYIKIDRKIISEDELRKRINQSTLHQ